jgi:hypothetical protein
MSHAPLKGFVASSLRYVTKLGPLSTAAAKCVLNNAIQLNEQSAQVRIKWIGRTTGDYRGPDTVAANTWQLVFSDQIILARRPNLRAFPMRVRLAGSISNASYTATFRVVVGAESYARLHAVAGPATYGDVLEFTSTSTTIAWLGGGLLTMDPALSFETARSMQALNTTTGALGTRMVHSPFVQVWTRTTNVAGVPRLGGLVVEEFASDT